MHTYKQDSHFRKRDVDVQELDTALAGWIQGVETLESGDTDAGIEAYLWALSCRSTIDTAIARAPFKERKKLEARLPDLDSRFKAATVPAKTCVLATRECDPEAEWWYFRVPASHPDWPEHGNE